MCACRSCAAASALLLCHRNRCRPRQRPAAPPGAPPHTVWSVLPRPHQPSTRHSSCRPVYPPPPSHPTAPTHLRFAPSGRPVEVERRALEVLLYLLRHAGEVVTRTMLLEKVWDFHFDPKTSVVETHISRLRNKIDKGFPRQLIRTIRAIGYVLG